MVEFEEIQSCYNNENKLCKHHYFNVGTGFCGLTFETVKPEDCSHSHKRYVLISKVVKTQK